MKWIDVNYRLSSPEKINTSLMRSDNHGNGRLTDEAAQRNTRQGRVNKSSLLFCVRVYSQCKLANVYLPLRRRCLGSRQCGLCTGR